MRPGCDRPAAARVAFDPVALQLWLDPLARRSAPVQELCEFHVERLTIPRGWTATDRRPGVAGGEVAAIAVLEPATETPRVVEVAPLDEPEPEPVVEAQPEPIVVVEPEPEPEPIVVVEPEPEPEPIVVVEPEPEPEPVVVVEPEPEPVVVVEPEPEPEPVVEPDPEPAARPAARERTRSSGRPKGRRPEPSLLSRAFELTGHQESILTRPSTDPADAPSGAPVDD
jgi:hypothetical protein